MRYMNKVNNPKISVLMACYNSSNTLKESIDSILDQTFRNFEFLIIDDGSSDDTYKKLQNYQNQDSRIRVFKNNKNIGLTKSLNILINETIAPIIARQDADDVSIKSRFEKQFSTFKNNKYDVCTARAKIKNSNRNIPKYSYFFPKKLIIKYKNPFIHGTLMIRKDALVSIGGYDERFYYSQDYELFYKLQKNNFKFKNIYEPLYVLNTENNISSNFRNEQKYYSDCVKARKSPTSIENMKFTD